MGNTCRPGRANNAEITRNRIRFGIVKEGAPAHGSSIYTGVGNATDADSRRDGKADASQLVKDAALRLLDEEARFRAAVLEGKAYADRVEFIEEKEMDARFEEMLRS